MSNNKNRLLVICGPTGVGKTALGIDLAKKFNGEIISADSRQVYKGLDVGTGKDLENAKWKDGNWVVGGVPIYMLDVVKPNEPFAVSQYQTFALKRIDNIQLGNKLPILLGGTGLYIKSIVDGIETIGIPPNRKLREQYKAKSVQELFMILSRLNPDLANLLNKSEQSNKQRLLRRIEIAQTETTRPKATKRIFNTLMLGLICPNQALKDRINERVATWIKDGIEKEIHTLVMENIGWETQAMSAIGYRQWKPYFEGKMSREKVIDRWKTDEYQYAKRQLTWFKKDPRIKWFNVSSKHWKKEVEKTVTDWYN